jgi:hypothetical protein
MNTPEVDFWQSLIDDINKLPLQPDDTHVACIDDIVECEPQAHFQPSVNEKNRKKRITCEDCDEELEKLDALWRRCPKCDNRTKIHSSDMENCDSMSNYNSMTDGSMPARIKGAGIHKSHLNRYLMQSADSTKQRRTKIIEGLRNILFRTSVDIPIIHLERATDIYCDIAKRTVAISGTKYVYRAAVQKSILAVLTNSVLQENNLRIPDNKLCIAFDVTEPDLSKAKRKVCSLRDRGLIAWEDNKESCKITLSHFIKLLKLDEKYIDFLYTLIKRAESKNLHLIESTTERTKCAGSIYMLTACVRDINRSLTSERIAKKCGVTVATFVKYYRLLLGHPFALKKIFKKYRVPMPAIWKEKIHGYAESESVESEPEPESESESESDEDSSESESESSSLSD